MDERMPQSFEACVVLEHVQLLCVDQICLESQQFIKSSKMQEITRAKFQQGAWCENLSGKTRERREAS